MLFYYSDCSLNICLCVFVNYKMSSSVNLKLLFTKDLDKLIPGYECYVTLVKNQGFY